MTTDRICHYLHNPGGLDLHIRQALTPVNLRCPELEEKLDHIFLQVRDLRRQRDGLTEIMPANATQYRVQYQDHVRKLAEQWQADLEETP